MPTITTWRDSGPEAPAKRYLPDLIPSTLIVPNTLQWRLEDNLPNTVVLGNEVNGVLSGGNTTNILGVMGNGMYAFHLDGASQYVTVPIPVIWPHAAGNLWTKYAANPVITGLTSLAFGEIVANPLGGWYWFDCQSSNVQRWKSNDLITWTDKTLVFSGAGVGHWDRFIQVVCVTQKPDGTWLMLYRGADVVMHIGLATSPDATTWTRKNNGGVDDGLFSQFGNNYDPTTIMLIGSDYYVYCNGDPTHGVQNIYVSTDDFQTFSLAASNLFKDIGNGGQFCVSVWAHEGFYYALVPHDFVAAGTALYDHRISLYRCASPLFPAATTEFLGHAIVNDQAYDANYLDTPSVPMTDVTRSIYPAGFGDNLYALYNSRPASGISTVSLASMSLARLKYLTACVGQLFGQPMTLEFWVQFDALTNTMPIWSIGNTRNDGGPQQLMQVRLSGADKVLAMLLGGGYRLTTFPLAINTPYHIVITDDQTTTTVYVNGAVVGAFLQRNALATAHVNNIYFGSGFDGYLDGFIQGWKIYPLCLSQAEVALL